MKVNRYSVECVWDKNATLGESPLYDPRSHVLIWVDIKQSKLHRCNLATVTYDTWDIPNQVSAIGLHKKGGYVCANRQGFHRLTLDVERQPQLDLIFNPNISNGHRFNDGKVDAYGNFWAGTMDDEEIDDKAGDWWCLSPNGKAKKVISGFHVTNGPVFDENRKLAYFTDSAKRTIYVAECNESGSVGQLRNFAQFEENQGYPDGMALDRDGRIWAAFWDGNCIRQLAQDGSVLQQISMPVPRPTSIAFAGKNIFVTSASIGLSPELLSRYPLSGGLFKIEAPDCLNTKSYYFDSAVEN